MLSPLSSKAPSLTHQVVICLLPAPTFPPPRPPHHLPFPNLPQNISSSTSPECKAMHGYLSCETITRCQERRRGGGGVGGESCCISRWQLPDCVIKTSHHLISYEQVCTPALLPLLPGSAIPFATLCPSILLTHN